MTLFSADKPNRFFRVIKFWLDETSGIALELKTCVPSHQVEDEEGRIDLLIHLPIEDGEHRWCLWRPDQVGFDSRCVFDGSLVRRETLFMPDLSLNSQERSATEGRRSRLIGIYVRVPDADWPKSIHATRY